MSMESPVIPPPALDPLIQARLREFVLRRRGLILRRGLLALTRAGLGGPPGALAAKMLAEQPFLNDAGRVLDAYVSARNTSRKNSVPP